jgi:hypothetical protein
VVTVPAFRLSELDVVRRIATERKETTIIIVTAER